jgi:hypothetical protein
LVAFVALLRLAFGLECVREGFAFALHLAVFGLAFFFSVNETP